MSDPEPPGPPLLQRAHGGPAGTGRLRAQLEHFLVREELGFAADGSGDHVLLRVRKEATNTQWVARCLARQARVGERDVGYAGLKDRHAIAEQYFTVPVRHAPLASWRDYAGDGFRVLDAALTRRKLRRGAHRGNAFCVVVSELDADRERLEEILARIAACGAPNYFGPQRFGRAGANLRTAWEWFNGQQVPGGRAARSFALSAARAAIFNAVLAERVRAGTWNRLLAGDVANLANSGSIFGVDSVDDALERRCSELDLHPTGPLWGAGPLPVSGLVAELEADAIRAYQPLAAGLVRGGLEQERRALRTAVQGLDWSLEGTQLRLEFKLPRGTFATAVVHELIDDPDGAWPDAD